MQVVKRTEYDRNDFYELFENSWSGARDTMEDIINAEKEVDFMEYLNEYFGDDEIDETELNDFIWFERDDIYDALGLDENGQLIEDDEEDEDEEEDDEE